MRDISGIESYEGTRGERIYRIPVQAFPIFTANVYVIVDGDYTALIDTGSGAPASDADLEAGFEALRTGFGEKVRLATLSRIVLTHGHIDHYGGLDFVRARSDAPVAIHAYDRRVIEHHRERFVLLGRELARFFRSAGLGPEAVEASLTMYHGERANFRGTRVETVLLDGDTLDDRFKIHHTPGHCPGQICLQLGDLLFSADHVLPGTFPHLAPESLAPYTGLAHYLDALTTIEAVPGLRLTLPGHGQAIQDLGARIAQIRASNERKLLRVLEACEAPATIDEITQRVYPGAKAYQAILALEKVGAYVEHLAQIGDLAVANLDEVAASDACPLRFQRCPLGTSVTSAE